MGINERKGKGGRRHWRVFMRNSRSLFKLLRVDRSSKCVAEEAIGNLQRLILKLKRSR